MLNAIQTWRKTTKVQLQAFQVLFASICEGFLAFPTSISLILPMKIIIIVILLLYDILLLC